MDRNHEIHETHEKAMPGGLPRGARGRGMEGLCEFFDFFLHALAYNVV